MKSRILGLVIVGAGCLAVLPALAAPTPDGGHHAQYSSMGSQGSGGWKKDLWVDPNSLDTRHEARRFGVADFSREDGHTWVSPQPMPMRMPTPAAAPEFDRSAAAVALTLLLGGLAFWRARRRA